MKKDNSFNKILKVFLLSFIVLLISTSNTYADAFKSVTIAPGETYELTNVADIESDFDIESGYGYWSYIVYDEKGKIVNDDEITTNYTTSKVPEGGKVVITANKTNDNPLIFSVLGDSYKIKKIKNPAFKSTLLEPGDSCEFINISDSSVEFKESGHGYWGYVVYDKKGKIVNDDEINTNYTTSKVPEGGKVVITANKENDNSILVGGAYNHFNINKSDYPAFEKVELKPGQTYEFFNISDYEVAFNKDGIGYWSYVVYTKNGSIDYKESKTNYATSKVPAGGKVVITAKKENDESLFFGGAYPYFNKIKTIEFDEKEITIKKSETLQLKYSINPDNQFINKNVKWESSNPSIVEVIDGKIKGISGGTATIKVITEDTGLIAECKVKVDSLINWKEEKTLTNQSPDKIFKIDIEQCLDMKTIKDKNIYITDKDNKIVPVVFYQGCNEDKSIYILPVDNYKQGEKYILWIKTLSFKDNTSKEINTKTEFSIKK